MALRLHAITLVDAATDDSGADATTATGANDASDGTRVAFRELSAIVSEQPAFAASAVTPEAVVGHRRIVDSAFKRGAVLPAPVGVVFRAADVLTRWMELHYVSLSSALEYVEDRGVARVHILRADGKEGETSPDADLATQASEAARALRRRAVAGVPLRAESPAGVDMGSAFLVEIERWKDFLSAVSEQQDAHQHLTFKVTGPWAPYDFVRMQFGG